MKRFEKGLIFLVALLACGNLALWLATREPSFHICAFRVAQIEYHTYRRAGPDTTEIPTEWNRRYRVIEDRADIRAICRLLREMELREYSVDGAGEAWQAWATYYTYRSCLVFRMKDGSDAPAELVALAGADREELETILGEMLDYAYEKGLLEENSVAYRDLFDTKIMSVLVPRPSEVIRIFHEKYEKSPKEATDYFYKLSQDTDYIRRYRIKKDQKWITQTQYGDLDITINLSKPEKDPKAIAAAKNAKQSGSAWRTRAMQGD